MVYPSCRAGGPAGSQERVLSKKVTITERYSAKDIVVLEGLEAVRRRPSMYIGSTGPRGLDHLVWEVVDNAIDEAMAGHCTLINVILQKDGSVRVSDNGRGIPVGLHTQTRMSALTTVLTVLHAGGKFEKGSYQVSGGLHGVGVSVVNALSSRLDAEVRREGRIWTQSFEKGLPMGQVEKGRRVARTGTTITFLPDTEIFPETRTFSRATVASRLRELAYLNRNLQIRLTDERLRDHIEAIHPDILRIENAIPRTLAAPDFTRIDSDDDEVRLYYKRFRAIWVVAAVAFKLNDAFVLTAYTTRRRPR